MLDYKLFFHEHVLFLFSVITHNAIQLHTHSDTGRI